MLHSDQDFYATTISMYKYGLFLYYIFLEKKLPRELVTEMIIYSLKSGATNENLNRMFSYFLNHSPTYGVLNFQWKILGK